MALSKQKKEEIVYGLLKTADIVGMEEASVIFDLSSDFSKKNMTYMQITMNPLWDSSCRITKKLGNHIIDFKPHASFILTSYPPDRLAEKITKTGFLLCASVSLWLLPDTFGKPSFGL